MVGARHRDSPFSSYLSNILALVSSKAAFLIRSPAEGCAIRSKKSVVCRRCVFLSRHRQVTAVQTGKQQCLVLVLGVMFARMCMAVEDNGNTPRLPKFPQTYCMIRTLKSASRYLEYRHPEFDVAAVFRLRTCFFAAVVVLDATMPTCC